MEAVCSSETSGPLRTTWRNNPEHRTLHSQRHGSLKSSLQLAQVSRLGPALSAANDRLFAQLLLIKLAGRMQIHLEESSQTDAKFLPSSSMALQPLWALAAYSVP
jgi:hypothetical protein